MAVVLVELSSGEGGFALLEDLFVRGSYRVVQTETDKDSLQPDVCKEGMLVKCLDSKKNYILTKMEITEDMFGDKVATLTWNEFKLSVPNTGGSRALSRWSLELTADLAAGEEKHFKLNLTRAVVLAGLEVNDLCQIKLKETNSLVILADYGAFNHELVHEFTDQQQLKFGKYFAFSDGTVLNTRYTNFFMNKDIVPDNFLYFTLKNTGLEPKNIRAILLFVGLHTA